MLKIEVPIKECMSADVAVVGGGAAGCFAAIAAANAGAKTILIEKNGMLGGTITCAAVSFPGLFFAWGRQIIDGPCWRAIKRANELGGAQIPPITKRPERHWHEQILINRFIFARVLDEFCLNAGVDVKLHAMISHAVEDEDRVRLIITGKDGLRSIDAKIVIDATGDANLTSMLGYPCVQSKVLQPATLQNNLSGYNADEINKDDIIRAAREGIKRGELPPELNEESLYGWLLAKRINFHVACDEGATSEGKTRVEMAAREKLMLFISFLKKLPGLQNLEVEFVAEECGIRETKRIVGEKTVTAEDYIKGHVYDDAVCYAFYPIDLHVMDGIEQVFLEEGVVPTIPYKALIPKGAKRLLAAGRCLSSDPYANSALRVQAPCMAMGQAAGCAAAIAAKSGVSVRDVEYDELCKALKKQGAIVPDKKAGR